MRLGDGVHSVPERYLSIYLHESHKFFRGGEESRFSGSVCVQVRGSEIFMRTTMDNNAKILQGRNALVYQEFVQLSILDLSDSMVDVTIVLYFKAK